MKTTRLVFLSCMLLAASVFNAMAQRFSIDRVEPPFWYTEMKYDQVQILVYGRGIAVLTPSVVYPGLSLDTVVRTENQNYLFIYLTISQNAKPGVFEISFSEKGRTEAVYLYKLEARRPGSARREGFSNSDVIYLITPDRFANAEPGNDDVTGFPEKSNRNDRNGRHGGDLKGVINHLDYIAGMGFTALWLNPVLENNQPEFSYHGYSMTDLYRTDPRFGTNEDYRELGRQASARGVRLIMDMVMNHIGSGHWWMKDLPSTDWINNGGKFRATSHRRTTLNDPYASAHDREAFVNGWFVPSMPDLNQENRLLGDYLIQNSIWWIEYADLGGIRHDTHPYAGKEFMARWTCRIMDEYPSFNIVGEEWSENPSILAKWQRGKQNPDGYQSCLPSLMDFPLQMSLTRALTEPESWNTGFIRLYEMISNDFLYPEPFNLVIFPDNHDIDRFYTQVNEDSGLFRLGIAYFLTMRGIPQIQYGTEIQMTNAVRGDHGLIRTDFPGGWTGDKTNGFTGAGLSTEQADAQAFMKKLLNWRKSSPLLHNGNLMHYSPFDGLYVYFRYDDSGRVMVLLNKGNNPAAIDPFKYPEMLEGIQSGTDVMTGVTKPVSQWLVPGKSPLILDLH
jgi:glycosidase